MAKYEELARSLLKHHGEKGRVVESVVKSALRAVLPRRYNLGTGFVITASGHSTSQLDLVIYDEFYNSPILLDGGVGIFPIECVYGTVEVKSCLNGEAIKQIASTVGQIRQFAKEKTYVRYRVREDEPGKPTVEEAHVPDQLSPRAYAFALRSSYRGVAALSAALAEQTQAESAHVHGLAVVEHDWFISQLAYTTPHAFEVKTGQAFAAFTIGVLRGIQSINMQPAAIERYVERLLE
jgi:hypothetical protein